MKPNLYRCYTICILVPMLSVFCLSVRGVKFQELHSFAVQPQTPEAALVKGSDGSFYGTTSSGGVNGYGTVFKVSPSGTPTTLVSFAGTNGNHPVATLALGSDGNFYGTTFYGGVNGIGTVFKVTPAGTLTTLVSFAGTNGSQPRGGVVQGSDGNFYGTTVYAQANGSYGNGTVFKITPSGTLTTLYAFSGADGAYPGAALVQGSDGNFYGTTEIGGTFGYGTVFRMTPSGTLSTLVSFASTNGYNPAAALVQGSDGNFYGTTAYGGASGDGTVFRMTPSGTLSTLVSFAGTNGYIPVAALVQGNDGNFYGTTEYGGASGYGSVFSVTPSGTLTTLVSFANTNGAYPGSALVQGGDGNFYGTTQQGGGPGYGTVFTVTPSETLTTLVSFGHNNGSISLQQVANRSIYGTTQYGGGTSDYGTLFDISPTGEFTTLYSFGNGSGTYPSRPLVQANDGNLYGTTLSGSNGVAGGTVFRSAPSGGVITMCSFLDSGFVFTNGFDPVGLVQGTDGNFYGATTFGGFGSFSGFGTLFKVTSSGALSPLFYFDGSHGAHPLASPVQATDGNFYGTTENGGASGAGTVFQITPSGILTTLVSFAGTNGANPYAALVQGADGNFYGTASSGGASNKGTVFQMTPSGMLTTLVSFTGTNGANPYAARIQGTDGNFYGTTSSGGTFNYGTLFQITPSGTLTTLVSFSSANGAYPQSPVVQCADGLYGTAISGGSNGGGNIYRINKIYPLSATANNARRAYGAVNHFTGAIGGLINGENITLDFATTASSNSPPGTYTITPLLDDHGTRALALYDVNAILGTLTITEATLIVTASDTNCVVNSAIPTFTGSIVGLQNNDNITVSFTTTATVGSAIGAYTITPVLDDHGTGALANYSVTTHPGTLTITPTAATIIMQPTSVTNYAGTTATFSVIAGGTAPLSYQWFKGTSKIGSSTASVLSLSNVQSGNAGSYKVVVSNSDGSITSAVVTLTVLPSVPTITSLPSNQTNIVGSTTAFTVLAVGSPTLAYQWSFNGSPIQGATSTTLKLSKISTSAAGTYTVVVSNGNGRIKSDPIVLTVVPETGTYNGLFYLTNGVENDSSGYVTFAMDGTRKFKGNVIMAAGKYPISGMFDGSGATITAARNGLSSLTMALQLVPTNDTAQVSGTVSDGVWFAQLLGDKAYYTTGTAAPEAGTYTFGLRSSSDGTFAPAEGSYGLLKVKTNGNVTLTGLLSDVTGISEASALSKDGNLPLFVPLYKGAGSLLGWITFTNAAAYKLTGNVSWIKTTAYGSYYASGFTNTVVLVGGERR